VIVIAGSAFGQELIDLLTVNAVTTQRPPHYGEGIAVLADQLDRDVGVAHSDK
jgi:hypothetical protein